MTDKTLGNHSVDTKDQLRQSTKDKSHNSAKNGNWNTDRLEYNQKEVGEKYSVIQKMKASEGTKKIGCNQNTENLSISSLILTNITKISWN